MTCMIRGDRPVDDHWSGGNRMVIDLARREMRLVIKKSRRTPAAYIDEREQQRETTTDNAPEDARRLRERSILKSRRCRSL